MLTPNWQSRLPGYCYQGDDPGGYMTMPEVITYVNNYAALIGAPVHEHTEVTSIRAADGGFVVTTNDGEWQARSVALASGPYNHPDVPEFAHAIPAGVKSITASEYRNPEQLEEGGVLVVGAAATGVQLAEELQQSGRPVTLAVGGHVRLPRVYRGVDTMWWLDAAGVLDERYDQVDDIVRARSVSSFQLVGSPNRSSVDLNSLQSIGVRIVGRLAAITVDGTAQFSGSLPNQCALADLKLGRLLDSLDDWAASHTLDRKIEPAERPAPTWVPPAPPAPPTALWPDQDCSMGQRVSISLPWLEVPVLDAKGGVRHDGGITPVPGLYLMSATFLRRRKSTFIDGAGDDARDLSAHLTGYLDQVARVL